MLLRCSVLRPGWALALFVFVVGSLVGCGGDEAPSTSVAGPSPDHYRDFESADRLSAYLRSDALPLVSAHRGGGAGAHPENAIASFAQSLTHGPVLLEADVQMTGDSVLVLMHDETLNRTTTGSGPVRAQTLSEIRALRLVTRDGDVTQHQVPTLAEALAWADGRAVLQLDVTAEVPRSRVAERLRRTEALDRALVRAGTLDEARWYHERLPALLLSVRAATHEAAAAYVEQIDPSRLVAFAEDEVPSADALEVLSDRNVPVAVSTVGERDRAARRRGLVVYRDLFDRGVDIIRTDEAALAHQAAATYRAERTSTNRP